MQFIIYVYVNWKSSQNRQNVTFDLSPIENNFWFKPVQKASIKVSTVMANIKKI